MNGMAVWSMEYLFHSAVKGSDCPMMVTNRCNSAGFALLVHRMTEQSACGLSDGPFHYQSTSVSKVNKIDQDFTCTEGTVNVTVSRYLVAHGI